MTGTTLKQRVCASQSRYDAHGVAHPDMDGWTVPADYLPRTNR